MTLRLRGGGPGSSDEDSDGNNSILGLTGEEVRHSTPKVSALRSKPGHSEDTTVEESQYQDRTTTESGNTIVFKNTGEDMKEGDVSEESSDGLFNVSPVDDGNSSDKEDRSRKRKLSDNHGSPAAKAQATTLRDAESSISEKGQSGQSKEMEQDEEGYEKTGDCDLQDLEDIGFTPPAKTPRKPVNTEVEKTNNAQDNIGDVDERMETAHMDVAREEGGEVIPENGNTEVEARIDSHDKIGEVDGEKQSKVRKGIKGGNAILEIEQDKHDVFDFVDEDLGCSSATKKPTKQASSSHKQTPPQEYKARRQPEFESRWREIGGATPEEDNRRGKMDLKVLELLVHQLAHEEGRDLSREHLKEDFFVRLVNRHGNVSGSTRMAAFKSSAYTLRLWRDMFCLKEKTKAGKMRAGVHLFEHPQEKENPCRLCNQQTGEQIGDHGELASQLQRATAPTQDERQECGHCRKQFKTRKTLHQHVKKVHPHEAPSEKGEKYGMGKRTVKDTRCERCSKVVGDLARHLKEFCRRNEDNLAECPHCKAMIVKSKLKEHIKGRLDKESGLKTKKGCEDKNSAGDKGPELETCSICFKSLKSSYLPRHMAKFHRGEDSERLNKQKKEMKKPVKQGNVKKFYISREFFLAALEEANVKQAEERSKKDLQPHEIQGLMVSRGLAFTGERGLNLRPPPRLVPMDGNCSFSTIALARDPSLGVLGLHMEATHLRTSSIAWAIEMIRTMDEEGLERVRLVATPDTRLEEEAQHLTREELIERLQRFAANGEYAGNLGDILLYVLSAFIQAPILVVDVNHANSPLGLFVSPRTLFGTEPVTNLPYVALRLQNHLEPLLVPEDARIPLQEMFAAQEAQEGPAIHISTGGSCNHMDGATVDKNEEGGSRHLQSPHSTDTLATPISTQGDRKTLLSFLPHLSPQFESKIRDLLKDLDSLFVNSPATIRMMEESQRNIQLMLDLVSRWAKKGKGGSFRTKALDQLGIGREPSSLQVYLSMIGKKILPFIRHHCFGHNDDFKVTDLVAFGSERWKRLTEQMVIDCNQEVGHSPALKKAILLCWSVLFRAISLAARDHVDKLQEAGVRDVEEWYDRLCRDVGPGITLMGAAATRVRTERREEAEKGIYVPVDVAIQRWLGSEERADLINNLHGLADQIRRGEQVNISSATYSALSELVQTELGAYSVVRIGAWGRMTLRGFLKSRPAWQVSQHGSSTDTRPVTTPPDNACHHQKIGKGTATQSGLNKEGNRCCNESVAPTCYITVKDQDKGGKANSFMVFSHEAFRQVLDFLVVRDAYFRKLMPEQFATLDGSSPIFLSSRGKAPGPTSNFRLKMFNKVVFGSEAEIVFTPQHLRKFNTTYLNQHPDDRIRAIRGAATGNSDGVFNEHYNLTRQAQIMDALLASLRRHHTDGAPALPLSQEHDQRREKDEAAVKAANLAVLQLPDGVDLTSRQRPVHRHLRHQLRQELTRLSPGLWERAGTGGGTGLSEMAWIKEVVYCSSSIILFDVALEIFTDNLINIFSHKLSNPALPLQVLQFVGRVDADILRDVILQQYRGDENPSKRQWSGVQSHLASIDRERKADNPITRFKKIATKCANYIIY